MHEIVEPPSVTEQRFVKSAAMRPDAVASQIFAISRFAMALKLKGWTAAITGTGGGIGRGIALAPAHRGRHLAPADIDKATLARARQQARSLRVIRKKVAP